MTTSPPGEAICPGCFKQVRADAPACAACGARVWTDGRLLLVAPIEEGRAGMFSGLLRAEDGRLEDVAVKVLDVGGLPNWRDYDRFRRQDEILGSLSHPHIPRARGNFEVGPRVLQCQTLIAGRSLARKLRGARMTPAEVTRLADELLDVLGYLHDRDVVHRDVKPDNVVIAADGSAHLVDFGGARRMHAAKKGEPEPTVVGTPGYMAPEQTLGEAMPQSDLYALGRLLTEALAGAQAERPLAALLPLLTRESWQKRPASAAAALRLLHPTDKRSRRTVLAIVGGLSVASAAIGTVVAMQPKRMPAPAAAAPAAAEASPEGPSLTEQARALLYEWSLAQNERDVARYGRCYAPEFRGVRRTSGGTVVKLDRDAWLKDRARILSQPVDIEVANVDITADDQAGTAVITLVQRFRRGNYADHGRKRLTAKRFGTALLFTDEEMLDSKRGWDDNQYAAQVPIRAADCGVAFDPSNHKYFVTLANDEDFAEALRVAGKSRRAKRPAEIVWGPAFLNLGPGFWVLAGALDDEAKADALAARVGGEVHEVALAPQPYRGIAQLVARREVPNLYGDSGLGQMMTVVNGIAYVVTFNGIESFSLTEAEMPSIRTVAYDSKPVRIVEHAGAPHLLDVEGHWWRVGEKLERVPSFDPDDNAGKVVKFGSITFAVDEESVTISGAEHEEQAWPLGTKDRALFKVSGERLALLRDRTVFVFTIGKPKPRLTKLCIGVDTGRKITGPASYSFGPMHLVSDRSGKLDVWTDEWGFIDPSLTSSSTLDCSEGEYETGNIDLTPLFGQISVSVAASINCEYECGD